MTVRAVEVGAWNGGRSTRRSQLDARTLSGRGSRHSVPHINRPVRPHNTRVSQYARSDSGRRGQRRNVIDSTYTLVVYHRLTGDTEENMVAAPKERIIKGG